MQAQAEYEAKYAPPQSREEAVARPSRNARSRLRSPGEPAVAPMEAAIPVA